MSRSVRLPEVHQEQHAETHLQLLYHTQLPVKLHFVMVMTTTMQAADHAVLFMNQVKIAFTRLPLLRQHVSELLLATQAQQVSDIRFTTVARVLAEHVFHLMVVPIHCQEL
jgi:hypothetical protein